MTLWRYTLTLQSPGTRRTLRSHSLDLLSPGFRLNLRLRRLPHLTARAFLMAPCRRGTQCLQGVSLMRKKGDLGTFSFSPFYCVPRLASIVPYIIRSTKKTSLLSAIPNAESRICSHARAHTVSARRVMSSERPHGLPDVCVNAVHL